MKQNFRVLDFTEVLCFFASPLRSNSYLFDHFKNSKPDMDLIDNLSFQIREYIIVLDGTRTILGIWNFGIITHFWNVNDILENDLDYNILRYGKILLTEIRF